MKLKKFVLAGLATASVVALASCNKGDSFKGSELITENEYDASSTPTIATGYTSLLPTKAHGSIDADGYYTVGSTRIKTKNVFKTTYATEMANAKYNYLINQWQYNSYHYCNMVDGLVENDQYGNIVGALATSYKTGRNAAGKQTWTFKLREGVRWVDNKTGKVVGEVKADDFVAGIEYVLNPNNGSQTVGVVSSVINGAEAYYNSLADADATNDLAFSTVGVRAVSDFEVEYTLIEDTPYFLSNLTYSPFLPVDREYLDYVGTDFGTSANNILVNGAFRVTKHEQNSLIKYTKNEHYWDKNHVYVDTVERKFVPNTATPDTTRKWFENGDIDSFTVSSKDTEGYNEYVTGGASGTGSIKNPASAQCNAILSQGDATYIGYFNFGRDTYEYSVAADTKTDAQKTATKKALKNVNFRKAFLYGINPLGYLKQINPDEPYQYLMRGYTNYGLCAADGKDYTEYVEAEFNRKQGTTGVQLAGIKQEGDPIFDAQKAMDYLTLAKQELIASGELTEADFPIQIDVIGDMDVTAQPYEYEEYALFLPAEMNANVNLAYKGLATDIAKVCYNIPKTDDENTEWGSITFNYDYSMWSGWGPDYADPKTYLATMSIGGDMVNSLGLDKYDDPENVALAEEILGDYDALYQTAIAELDIVTRYEKMAAAEYALIYDYAIIVPWYTRTGYYATVARTIPHQAANVTYGLSADRYKNVVVSSDIITKTVRAAVVADYEANK